ncbi:MAG: hypothetical protein HOO04_07040 [Phycisphaerae bacterium]|nr:hypothetical protein [Phycisphaerae bacterium]MBT5381432.1 hypothetical protein [Phycisphaerae bacterium]
MSRPHTSSTNERTTDAAPNHTASTALPRTDALIRSLDRILRPEGEEPFVMTCGGLSRLRGKTG